MGVGGNGGNAGVAAGEGTGGNGGIVGVGGNGGNGRLGGNRGAGDDGLGLCASTVTARTAANNAIAETSLIFMHRNSDYRSATNRGILGDPQHAANETSASKISGTASQSSPLFSAPWRTRRTRTRRQRDFSLGDIYGLPMRFRPAA